MKNKFLAFYKVDNEKEYGRYSFDTMDSEEILKALNELPDEQVRFYELCVGYSNKMLSLSDFVEDYNDEELDGGWWSILI